MGHKSVKNNLEQLKNGLWMRAWEKECAEPENIAIGRSSYELRFLQRQSEYANEIVRILQEMSLTLHFTSHLTENPTEKVGDVGAKDLVCYYQGVFLTLVHQMKDKLIQLVDLMTEQEAPEDLNQKKKFSLARLLQRKGQAIDSIGIGSELSQWNQEDPSSGISVALRRRTAHHHNEEPFGHLMDIARYGTADMLSLKYLTTAFRPKVEGNLYKMKEALSQLED